MLRLATIITACLTLAACFQAQLNGPVAGSSIVLSELDSGTEISSGSSWDTEFVISALGQEKWDSYGADVQLWLLGIYAPNTDELVAENYYLLSASGGFDTDIDLDRENDVDPGTVSGTWRTIISGAHAKEPGAKVSALTEAIYQYLSPNLANLSSADLEAQLDLLAQRLVDDVNGDGSVDYFDALLWSRLFDADKLLADTAILNQFSDAITAGDTDLSELATALIDSGADHDGEWVYRFSRPDGNSFTCAHCHAIVEPAQNGFSRPGHPLGDATARLDFKDGQLSSMLDAANTCLDEWMNAQAWSESSADWLALEAWLETHAPPGTAESVDIQIVDAPTNLEDGDASAGLDTFNRSCAICHAEDGGGSLQAPAIGGLGYSAEFVANRVRSTGRSDSAVYTGLSGGIMPFWGANRLSDQELVDVVAFLALGQDDLAAITGDTTDGSSTDSGCGNDHERVGYIAELSTLQHRVSGTATIIDNCTIEITDFTYDGRGIVVQAYTGRGYNFTGRSAHAISPNLVGTAYENATVQYTLPEGVSLDNFTSLSIWCVEVGISFGDGIFGPP